MPDPMPPPVPPANSVPAQAARKKARWPWIVGGCGCLTLIGLCIAALVIFYSVGTLGKNMVRFEFGANEWKRDGDGAIQRFLEASHKSYLLEIAGSKYNGILHAGGHYRLTNNTLFYTLSEAWIDTGRGGGDAASKLSPQAQKELGFKQEQKRRITWLDANTFKLTEHWWSSGGETWRREPGEISGNDWHYSPAHKRPERWVDGRGWVRDESAAPPESTPPPESSAPESTNPLQDKEAKIAAAVKWLRLVDAGDYRASFAAASEEFRKDFGAPNMWEITLSTMRNSWGAVVSRGDKVTLNTTYSGRDKPKVSYQLDIKTKFAKNTATEQVTVVKESGEWKVAKYRRAEASSEKTPAPEAPAPDSSAPPEREAIKAVVDWLALLDEGDYRASFAAAAAQFRKGLTPEKWRASHASMQKEFGTLVSHGDRVTLRTRTSPTDGGKPQITYILDIPSEFSKATGTEHITLVKESGEWKVADYSIEVKTP